MSRQHQDTREWRQPQDIQPVEWRRQPQPQQQDNSPSESFNEAANQNNAAFVPRNESQAKEAELINNNSIIFSMGPAGTGKTYVEVHKAIEAYKAKEITKIVISRPLEEAGPGYGFDPGTKEEKMADWLVPIYDEFDKFFGKSNREAMQRSGAIEIVPLAKIRGRTFVKGTFVIIDEAQNCTYKDLFTIITRHGEGSKMVISGDPDPDQIDLKPVTQSGLKAIADEFKDVKGIAAHTYSEEDCVRSEVVKELLKVHKMKKQALLEAKMQAQPAG